MLPVTWLHFYVVRLNSECIIFYLILCHSLTAMQSVGAFRLVCDILRVCAFRLVCGLFAVKTNGRDPFVPYSLQHCRFSNPFWYLLYSIVCAGLMLAHRLRWWLTIKPQAVYCRRITASVCYSPIRVGLALAHHLHHWPGITPSAPCYLLLSSFISLIDTGTTDPFQLSSLPVEQRTDKE